MATNSGIEVTALRPAAQAGDFYVRPDQTPSGISQGLARLSGTLNTKQNAEAKIRAEEAALSESLDAGNVEALHNRTAYAQESPAFMAYLNEIRGKNHASAMVSKLQSDWQAQREGFDDTGTDFEGFLRDNMSQTVEAFQGNRYMMAGASGVFAEATHNLRAQNRQYVDSRTRESLVTEFSTETGTTALALASNAIPYEVAQATLENSIQTVSGVGGMTLGEASEQSFKELVAFYGTTDGDSAKVLKLINSHPYVTGPNGKEPTRLEGIILIDNAIQTRSDNAYRESERAYVQQERAKAVALEETATTIQTVLIKDPTSQIPDELKSAYVKSGGQLATLQSYESNALALHKKPVSNEHKAYANNILADIYKETYKPESRVTINDILVDASLGFIHPTQVADLMQKVQQASQVAPLGEKREVTDARNRFTESIVGSSSDLSATTRKRKANLEIAFDEGFREAVSKWYSEGNEDPNFSQLTDIVSTLSQKLKGVADLETEDIKYEVLVAGNIRKAKKWALTNQATLFNPSIEDVEAGIATNQKVNPAVMKILLRDPMQVINMPPTLGGGQAPVIEVLDRAFGDGAAHVWMEAHKGDY
jgi:hypothetical protein